MNKGFMADKVKKFVCLAVAIVMLFSLVGLSGCGVADLKSQIDDLRERVAELEAENEVLRASELALYKKVAKYELEAYAGDKGEDNYYAENWAEIVGLVAEGKTAIDAAEDKAGVDLALSAAKEAIDGIQKIGEEMEIVREKIKESQWDGKVEVLVDFPRAVKQGEAFEITVTTKNILDEDVVIFYTSGSQVLGGVPIVAIKLQPDEDNEIYNEHFFVSTGDAGVFIIQVGEQREAVWIFEGKGCFIDQGYPQIYGVAHKGVYDIYLANGEVLRNAITIY
ncbi:MAG: hypothetical protein FWE84_00795 [Firmicutes bacterium]|nr:hypothetical protein [Bacillota bacterium]